ncbi:MAG: hypothetical protein Q8L54_13115 [Devosia sp.]|nr:hypothetical protein [Devosia sp.]
MKIIQYDASAELYLGRDPKVARGLGFKRFETAAAAIRFAVEEATPNSLRGAVLEVGSTRFSGPEIAALYTDPAYPLPRDTERATAEERRVRALEAA